MDNTVIEHYETFSESLENIVFNHVAIKLATFKGFQESLNADFKKTTRSFSLLYFMVDSLQVDSVMTISKLTENDRGDKTIQKFLNFASANQKKLQKKYSGLTQTLIDTNSSELESVKQQIQRILTQRDKYYAHADNEYFLQPNKISIDFPNTYNDLVDIIRVLQTILNSHRHLITGSMRVCMSDFAYLNTFKTLELLNEASDEWFRKYRPDEKFD